VIKFQSDELKPIKEELIESEKAIKKLREKNKELQAQLDQERM
jgi:septal ring factor EnvC (AmiA/AmiB activator)